MKFPDKTQPSLPPFQASGLKMGDFSRVIDPGSLAIELRVFVFCIVTKSSYSRFACVQTLKSQAIELALNVEYW